MCVCVRMQRNPKLVSILDTALDSDDGRMCSLYEEFKTEASKDGLWYYREIPPWQLLPHTKNRDGEQASGQGAADVWNLVDVGGVIPSLWDSATAFEASKNDESYTRWFGTKTKIDKELPKYNPEETYIGNSVACSHWNVAMLMALQNRKHSNRNLTVGDYLSMEQICNRHPLLKSLNPFKGLRWVFWKKEAEELYPLLPELACRAENLKYATQQGIDSFALFNRAVTKFDTDKSVSVTDVERDLKKSAPKTDKNVCAAIAEVAQKWGGKKDKSLGDFYGPVGDFLTVFKQKNRSISNSLWLALQKLSQSQVDAVHLTPHLVMNILMTVGSSPTQSPISAEDLKKITSKQGTPSENVRKVEMLTKDLIVLGKTMGVTKEFEVTKLGPCRVSLTLKLFGKSQSLKETSYESLCVDLYHEMIKVTPHDSQQPCPWSAEPATQVNTDLSPPEEKPGNMDASINYMKVDYDEYGDARILEKNKVLAAGWKVGMYVKSRETGIWDPEA